jgi:hypothetical protein
VRDLAALQGWGGLLRTILAEWVAAGCELGTGSHLALLRLWARTSGDGLSRRPARGVSAVRAAATTGPCCCHCRAPAPGGQHWRRR